MTLSMLGGNIMQWFLAQFADGVSYELVVAAVVEAVFWW